MPGALVPKLKTAKTKVPKQIQMRGFHKQNGCANQSRKKTHPGKAEKCNVSESRAPETNYIAGNKKSKNDKAENLSKPSAKDLKASAEIKLRGKLIHTLRVTVQSWRTMVPGAFRDLCWDIRSKLSNLIIR